MRPHLLQDLGQSSNSPVPASLIKEQVYVYVYGRATQLASLMKEHVYVWERARNSLVFATLIKDGNVCVYVWGAAWRHCDSGNQAYMCRGETSNVCTSLLLIEPSNQRFS